MNAAIASAPASDGQPLTTLDGVGEKKADALNAAGYQTTADIQNTPASKLDDVDGITADFAASLKQQLDGGSQ